MREAHSWEVGLAAEVAMCPESSPSPSITVKETEVGDLLVFREFGRASHTEKPSVTLERLRNQVSSTLCCFQWNECV